jgi:2-keto-4-pentenoate hydratase
MTARSDSRFEDSWHLSSGPCTERWIDQEATGLLAAERSRVPVPLLTARRPGLTVEDAYRVQAAIVRRRLSDGARIVGHKVGATSAAMQQQMGVDEPDSGVLFEDMAVADGGELSRGGFLNPRVEAEIAFRLGRDLQGPDVDVEAARCAVSQVCLALEVIDTRFTADWRITLADSVADSASCARFVVGAMVSPDPAWDLGAEQLTLHIGGTPVATGEGRAVLGHPLHPLVWLVRRLHGLGAGLRAGDLVLAGAVHASIPLQAGTYIRLTSPHLPSVRLWVT